MAIKHTKVSGKSAGSDPTQVGGPDWDAPHTIEASSIGSTELAADAVIAAKIAAGAVPGGWVSFLLHAPDIIIPSSAKAFALPPSPPVATGFSGRIATIKVSARRTVGYVTVSQLFWQSGALNAGTITIKCIINGVANAATLAITSGSANPITSSAFAGIALAADDTLGWTADFSADLDANGLDALFLLSEIK